jgi:hypothetical protein
VQLSELLLNKSRNDFQPAVNSLHFVFVFAVITQRRLHVSKSPFTIPAFLQGKTKGVFDLFTPSNLKKCHLDALTDGVRFPSLDC